VCQDRPLYNSRILRFLIVGGATTALSYIVYAFLLFLGLSYIFASMAALVAGILFSFKTQGRFVFGNSDNRRIGGFVLCWVLIYVVNVTFIRQMIALGMSGYVSGALAIPVNVVLSYLVQRFIVFRPTEP
jgi:putative flippase GtrA